jgi:hypothetical protein
MPGSAVLWGLGFADSVALGAVTVGLGAGAAECTADEEQAVATTTTARLSA